MNLHTNEMFCKKVQLFRDIKWWKSGKCQKRKRFPKVLLGRVFSSKTTNTLKQDGTNLCESYQTVDE